METNKSKTTRTKDKILTRVLPLFLVNNYESVTISLIENATRITRGTIYKYFNNKEDIFNQAVYNYYDSPLNVLFALNSEQHTLEDYWKLKIQQLKHSYDYLRQYGIFANALAISHYIEVQATLMDPTFNEIVILHRHKNLKHWSLVLSNTPGSNMDAKSMSYQRAGLIYHGLYLQLCSYYPKINTNLPNIKFT
ncbi:MAG: TetR/AcrR family transcriptional regulator [Bacteroidales bacterium]|nr:TetR/AcrR family transcriptional regulator [Bacteroidales bacterium]MBQ7820610.1 TetR/AcrR family transcriptional regulator [Bacteroidales bacterium]